MKECHYCHTHKAIFYPLHHDRNTYVCNYCINNKYERFIVCDVCNIIIDLNVDYYADAYDDDYLCEECYFDKYNIHSHEYIPNITFLHKSNQNRKDNLHIGAELELATHYKKDKMNFLKEYNKYYVNKEFYFKHDGSISGHGVEIVSLPMTINMIAKYWKPLFQQIKQYNFQDTQDCGLHFHIDREYLNNNTIRNLDYIINNNKDYFVKFANRENEDYAAYRKKRMNHWGIDTCGKYSAVNLAKKNTVEIRICSSTIHYNTFLKRIKLIYALVDYCKHHTLNDCINNNMSVFEREMNICA